MIDIRFDGPPEHETGRFVEVEREGTSISFGEWIQDGEYWLLRIPDPEELQTALKRIQERAQRVLEGEEWDLAGYCEEVISGLSL